jgi:hypothetical protein
MAPPAGMPGPAGGPVGPGQAPGAAPAAPVAKQSSVGLIIFFLIDLLSFALAILLVLGIFGMVEFFDVSK